MLNKDISLFPEMVSKYILKSIKPLSLVDFVWNRAKSAVEGWVEGDKEWWGEHKLGERGGVQTIR